jgi:hypothetical protein
MDNFESIKYAINNKISISFSYEDQQGFSLPRIGNPYVLYTFVSKDNEESIKVDLLQTGGESVSVGSSISSNYGFRPFNLDKISNLVLLENEPKFDPNEGINYGYNPSSERYKCPWAKV